jgi:transposase
MKAGRKPAVNAAQAQTLRDECSTGVTLDLFAQKLETATGKAYSYRQADRIRDSLGIPLIRKQGWKWRKNGN